jgi:hypothetical protein
MELDYKALTAMGFQPLAPSSDEMMSQMTPEQAALLEARKKKNISIMQSPDSLPFLIPEKNMLSTQTVTQDVSNPADRAYKDDLKSKYKNAIVGAEQDIADQRQLLSDVKNMKGGYDFTPLAGLYDKWSGGGNQLSAAAENISGMKPEEKAAMVAKLQDAISGKQDSLVKNIGARIDMNDATKLQQRMAEMADKNSRFGMAQDRALSMKFDAAVRQDAKPFYEIMPSYGAVEAALTPDANGQINAQRLQMALSNAARLMGEKGVLTDQDIGRIQAQTLDSMLAKVSNFATGPTATIPAEYTEQLKAAINDGKKSWEGALNKKLSATKNSFVAYGLQPVVANYVVDNVYGDKFMGAGGQPAAAAPVAVDPVAELLKAKKGK